MPCWNSITSFMSGVFTPGVRYDGSFTLLVLVLPAAPYSQPSGPHWSELASEWVSSMPKPVSSTSGSASGTSSSFLSG